MTPAGGPVDFLRVEDLLEIARGVLDVVEVRDIGLLASAAGRPQTTVFGDDAYPTLTDKAAALMHSIARNHALVDGNKRLAWLATVVFLDLNASGTELSDDDAFTLVMDASQGRLDVERVATRLRITAGG